MLRGRLVWGRFVTWVDECCILPDRSPFKPLTLSLHQLSQFTTRMIVWKWGFKVSQGKKVPLLTLTLNPSYRQIYSDSKKSGIFVVFGSKSWNFATRTVILFRNLRQFRNLFLLGAPKARANHFEMTFQKRSAGPGRHRYAEPRSENFRPPILHVTNELFTEK